MRLCNEQSGLEFEARFGSADGAPSIPLTAHWRLRCVTNDVTLKDWTEATPETLVGDSGAIVGVRVVIDVDGALNALVDRTRRRETREVQVVAAKDTPREYSETLQYGVVALSGGR